MATLDKAASAALRAPFPPSAIKWRVGQVLYNATDKTRGVRKDDRKGTPGPSNGDIGKAAVLAYLNTSLVKNRLDDVLGPDGWAFDTEPLTFTSDRSEVLTAKGVLTIAGVPRADFGEAGNNEKTKGAARDSLKRAAFLFGVGDYLAELGEIKADVEYKYGNWQIVTAEHARLASLLPRPGARPITPELLAVLLAWYGPAFEPRAVAMTADQAIALISSGAKPSQEAAKAAIASGK